MVAQDNVDEVVAQDNVDNEDDSNQRAANNNNQQAANNNNASNNIRTITRIRSKPDWFSQIDYNKQK